MGFPPRDHSGWNRDDRRPPPPRHSSAAVACRAVVMLTCLVGLVGAALFGTALPDMAKELLAGHWPGSTESANQLAPEAPPFTSPASRDWESWQADGSGNVPNWSEEPDPGAMAATPGLGEPQVFLGREPAGQSGPGRFSSAVSPDTVPLAGAVQASYELPAGQPLADTMPSQPYPDAAAEASNGRPAQNRFQPGQESHPGPNLAPPMVDRFTYIQTRLRELGATYYLLESWGSEGQYFRFHCRMAAGGNQGYTRHFEATESDALQAMAKVLGEVESWRATPY